MKRMTKVRASLGVRINFSRRENSPGASWPAGVVLSTKLFVEMKGGSLVFTSVRRRKASKICLHLGNRASRPSPTSRRADITRFDELLFVIKALRQWLLPEMPRTPPAHGTF